MSAMYSMCGDCGSDVPGSHTRGCSKWTPPVSETAAWTEQDERSMSQYARLSHLACRDATQRTTADWSMVFARELLRLRAENERLTAERDEMRHAPWRRWSVQGCVQDGSLLVCKGHHDKSAPCEFEEYIPKPAGRADIAAIGRTLSFFASAIKSGERWTDTCNAEQYNAMKSLAALRSELAAASRERETPPEIPDEVSFELWDSEGCFATGFDTPAAADDVKALYIHRRAESFLVRSTTSRSRVSDNG